MARPLRLEHAGAIWHVTSRGNARQPIVHDDVDRARFVEILGRVVPTVRWCLHAWVLMTNHYHLLIETPEPTLARGLRQLNGVFSQAFNRRRSRVGHVFQFATPSSVSPKCQLPAMSGVRFAILFLRVWRLDEEIELVGPGG
jgi:REP element-mobilizing transposase RayT